MIVSVPQTNHAHPFSSTPLTVSGPAPSLGVDALSLSLPLFEPAPSCGYSVGPSLTSTTPNQDN